MWIIFIRIRAYKDGYAERRDLAKTDGKEKLLV
jgi:hypothetical protein